MRIKLWGTRGSLPTSEAGKVKTGGNTTCFEIRSACLPEGVRLVVDGGSGFLPFAQHALKDGMRELHLLHTHYHHDHTQGVLIAPPIFMPRLPFHFYGTVDQGMGPRDVYESIMRPPLHPVAFGQVASHLTFHKLEIPSAKVFVVHPVGGIKVFDLEVFQRKSELGHQLPFGTGASHPIAECMVITMHQTDHPERTIGFRFTDNPLGKSMVVLTDEEVRAGLPFSLIQFLRGADLIIQDVQYGTEEYDAGGKAGFGHGTPEYAVRVAKATGIRKIGFTHHDPQSSDAKVEALLEEGCKFAEGTGIELFVCRDYMEVEA